MKRIKVEVSPGGPTKIEKSLAIGQGLFLYYIDSSLTMASCYVLFSQSIMKYYVGATQDYVKKRVIKHNNAHYGKNHFTAVAKDWVIFLDIKVSSFEHALRIEKHIKKMKSKIYIQNLKKYPELLNSLILKTADT